MRGQPLDLQALYRRTFGFVVDRAKTILRNDEEARDVAQDVFLRAWERRRELERCASPTGWLLVAATRSSFDRLRRRKTAQRLQPPSGEGGRSPQLELARALVQRLERESALRQQIVVLAWLDGMTQDEVAQQLDISRKTVQRHLDAFREANAGDELLGEVAHG